ncbi:hypothetical protein P389DRAFT_196478 [Cystobasidium minutum MCA 4210]|uniref:uncharacterized protein n=1 Tax=Cystobasidium minutum MCA 4210 TaxID=1397322 RepID=UPI0034CD0584|eukprot:jgi/Rhomi1/196478/gm1.4692_g
MEEQIDEKTPSLFLDYATADEEDRAMLDTHFKVTRAYYRLQTRNGRYMFRNGVSTSIAQMLLGHLQDRAKELSAELAKEKARQQELQECDQERRNELRIAIKEQNSNIEGYKRDVTQTEGTLERLRQKEEELDTQAKECNDSIEASKKVAMRYDTILNPNSGVFKMSWI